jgi:sugar lactone lactonase YvrE
VLYVGRHTQTLTGSGDHVTIPVGLAGVKGGSIQDNPPILSAYVNTFAGTKATQGDSTGIGIAASFYSPYGITTDGTNLYITDFYSNRISKIVIATQVKTNFIGHYSAGAGGRTEGDGEAAWFNTPRGITTDGTYLYVCDYGNNAIRRILIGASTGSVAANFVGTNGATGGATEGTGAATGEFHSPSGITYYAGNLYVADTFNNKIRKIEISTLTTSTLAGPTGVVGAAAFTDGTGANAEFNQPQGITNDGTYLYIADTANHRIRRILMSSGVTDTIAGTGIAGFNDGNGSVAQFNAPIGITTDGTYLYVADSVNHNIRKITGAKTATTAADTTVSIVAGISPGGTPGIADGYGTAARFNNPYGITTDGTNLYVTEYTNYDIRKIQ